MTFKTDPSRVATPSYLGIHESISVAAGLEEATSMLTPPEGFRNSGVLISNDVGYSEIGDELHTRLQKIEGGIGLSIGSGGAFSMLPSLRTVCMALIDVDVTVLKFNRPLADTLRTASSPSEVVKRVSGLDTTARSKRIVRQLTDEARAYGPYHWSDPKRFHLSQQALRQQSLAYINADLKDRNLGVALHEFLSKRELDISFMNLTNVHQWVGNLSMRRVLDGWPIRDGAPILYSMHDGSGGCQWPKIRLARDLEDYFARTDDDLNLESQVLLGFFEDD